MLILHALDAICFLPAVASVACGSIGSEGLSLSIYILFQIAFGQGPVELPVLKTLKMRQERVSKRERERERARARARDRERERERERESERARERASERERERERELVRA